MKGEFTEPYRKPDIGCLELLKKGGGDCSTLSLRRAAAMDRMQSRFHVRAGEFFPIRRGRRGRMRSVRAIAAAMVAVCIFSCGNSLHGQAVQGKVSQANDHAGQTSATLAESLRSSIGLRKGDPGFDADADLNGDGVVNAVDVALWRLGRGKGNVPATTGIGPNEVVGTSVASTGEQIIVEGQTTFALPGRTVSVLFLIRANTTQLLSYTLDVNIVPQSDSMGTVTANVSATNFYDVRNLITAGGAMRDPFFSVIQDNGDDGVSVTTITSDLSTVQAVDNVNDVLAEVFFDVPQNALGDFTIVLASGSALVDGNAASVPFTFTPGTIRVSNSIPVVSEWGMIVLSLSVLAAGSAIFVRRLQVAVGLGSGERI